jgi:hypothetical protein
MIKGQCNFAYDNQGRFHLDLTLYEHLKLQGNKVARDHVYSFNVKILHSL